jgi:hypothetical protein
MSFHMRLLEKPACLAIGSKLGSAFVALSAGSTHAGMSAAPISTNRPTTYRTSNTRFLAECRGKEVQLALNKWRTADVQFECNSDRAVPTLCAL